MGIDYAIECEGLKKQVEALKFENESLTKKVINYAEMTEELRKSYKKSEETLNKIHSLYQEQRARAEAYEFCISSIFGGDQK